MGSFLRSGRVVAVGAKRLSKGPFMDAFLALRADSFQSARSAGKAPSFIPKGSMLYMVLGMISGRG